MAIVFNQLGVGATQLSESKLNPIHKKRAEKALSQIFHSHVTNKDHKKEFPFQVQLKPGKATLIVDNQEIPLKNSEVQKLKEVIQYYQNTGLVPTASGSTAEKAKSEEETAKTVKAVNEASIPGSNGSMLAGMRVADDSLSLTRNVLFSLPAFGPKDAIASHLGYYAGLFWTFFAVREIDSGIVDYKRSSLIKDKEGKIRSQLKIASGSIVTGGSALFLAGKICDSFATAATAAPILSASNILFGVGSVLSLGISIAGLYRCHRFNEKFDEYFNNDKLSEEQKLEGAIQFLKNAMTVTPEERASILAKIEKKQINLTGEEKEKLLNQKIADLTEVKVKRLKSRTSNKSIRLILEHADHILSDLRNPDKRPQGIRDATLLINSVKKDSKIKMGMHALGVVAGIIGLIATAILAFATAGALPFVLYGIAATIYLAMTVYTFPGLIIKYDEDTRLSPDDPIIPPIQIKQ